MCITLQDYISDSRKILKGDVYFRVMALQTVKLMIRRGGSKDKFKVKQLIKKLRQWQMEEDDNDNVVLDMTETEVCMRYY